MIDIIKFDIINNGKCIVCGKDATTLLFCDDCNKKRKEIEMKREQLRRAKDIERRLKTIDYILNCYNNSGNAIIGISVVTDDLDIMNQIPDFNVLLTKKFQNEALKLLKEYKESLEEEFENL